jgi:hypothetical protein
LAVAPGRSRLQAIEREETLYPGAADWESAELAKLPGAITYPDGHRVAMFTVIDAGRDVYVS